MHDGPNKLFARRELYLCIICTFWKNWTLFHRLYEGEQDGSHQMYKARGEKTRTFRHIGLPSLSDSKVDYVKVKIETYFHLNRKPTWHTFQKYTMKIATFGLFSLFCVQTCVAHPNMTPKFKGLASSDLFSRDLSKPPQKEGCPPNGVSRCQRSCCPFWAPDCCFDDYKPCCPTDAPGCDHKSCVGYVTMLLLFGLFVKVY
ncbi:hypothetical protein FQN53_004753 [Emmonsiellopsis sp. PD_33]|nr:hypothetical protein FQN53_004753 [Emmonsiellopsis sp. PD_33]